MPSFYELMKYARTGIASPDMTGFDKLRAKAAFGGYPVSTITGVPPISFKADGSALTAWSIAGNMGQTGTPTPDAPIMPEFVGVRTGNLFNASETVTNFIIDDANGNERQSTGSVCSDYIEIEPQKSYTITPMLSGNWGAWYDENKVFISGINRYGVIASPAGAKYVRLTVNYVGRNPDYATSFMVVQGTTAPATFIPYGYKIPITCAGQTTPVYLGQVSTVRRVKNLVLTGSETVTKNTDNPTNYIYFLGFRENNYPAPNSSALSLCTHLKKGSYSSGEYTITGTNGTLFVNFGGDIMNAQTSGNTVDGLKEYLAAQYAAGTPVTVWYVLATPQTGIVNEPLCKIGDYADELSSADAGVTIPTANGQNTLTVDTELQPSAVSVTGNIKPS